MKVDWYSLESVRAFAKANFKHVVVYRNPGRECYYICTTDSFNFSDRLGTEVFLIT